MTDEKPDSATKQIRNGPLPLGLHVTSAAQNWAGAAASFPLFHLGGLQIHPDLKQTADDLHRDMAGLDMTGPDMTELNLAQLQLMIMQKAQSRLSDMLAGVTNYQHHPFQRKVAPADLFYKIGTTEIRDYGPTQKKGRADDAPIVLVVPSLVNPAYILDLAEDHSFMRTLADEGIHPYLVDWTKPGAEEKTFGLEPYILKRLIPVIRQIHQHHNKKIHLLGYCMGGNLSLAAAQILQSENVLTGNILKSLTIIAAPWDFHVDQPAHMPGLTDCFLKIFLSGQHNAAFENFGSLNLLQLFFFSLDPTVSDRKFRKFSTQKIKEEQKRHFIAIEDWANDGVPLARQVAKDCLLNWYQQNQPQNGCWQIGGHIIDPKNNRLPGHIITPKSDRVVPPASAMALRKELPDFTHTSAKGGHVTMMAGRQSSVTLWRKIASYIK